MIALRKKYGHEKTHQLQTFDLKECGLYLQYKKQGKKILQCERIYLLGENAALHGSPVHPLLLHLARVRTKWI